jgi:glycosyltransferase involved in cell wall biosynthesis
MALRKKIGLSNNDKVIGIVANFRRVKNHMHLLRAFSELIKDYTDVKLLLVGQGFEFDPENSEQEIHNFVNENLLHQNVFFLGYRSDIPEILSIMDIFCLTSFKEGLPVSLIEAMAAGLPVVGTDVEGIRDVIIPDRNGFLTQVGDVNGLKNVLQTLFQNASLRHKFGHESKILAAARFSLEKCIKDYENLFLSLHLFKK